MRKQLIGMALSLTCSVSLCTSAFAASTQTTESVTSIALSDGVLQFDELDNCVRNGNFSVLSCTESMASLDTVNRKSVYDSLKSANNGLSELIWYYTQSGMDASSLKSQQASIEEQMDSYTEEEYEKTYTNAALQINGAVNQIIKGSESLYFGILQLDDSMKTAQRSLSAMDRSIDTMTLRYQLGQASKEDLRALQDQRSALKSQITALQTQNKINLTNLKAMIGSTTTKTITLAVPSAIDDATIAAIDLESDIAQGKEASADLNQARLDVEDAKDTWDDVATSPKRQHDYQNAVYTLSAAESNFEVQATTLYQNLLEAQRLHKVAVTDLDSAETTYQIAETKYTLGMISKQDLRTAQDTLDTAEQAVDQALLNVNTAYASYLWVSHGIAAAS